MKKEYKYLVAGAVVSASVLLGMGVVSGEKQTTEGRYQFLGADTLGAITIDGSTTNPVFGVMDEQTGTVDYVARNQDRFVFPFMATQAK